MKKRVYTNDDLPEEARFYVMEKDKDIVHISEEDLAMLLKRYDINNFALENGNMYFNRTPCPLCLQFLLKNGSCNGCDAFHRWGKYKCNDIELFIAQTDALVVNENYVRFPADRYDETKEGLKKIYDFWKNTGHWEET